ncbi:10684_t:CDS:2 [Dentiscutata heterogama]|uniref:10684_t:CDS:1 n=1 Tax=Dentiscutata heterogama TaxID=1316150 RepID=A0ACA9M5Q6_9GLOM|nr:10684_t:CDS:2 [Dentiscutata heterogama]
MNPQPIPRIQTVIHVNSTNNALDIDQRYTDLVEGVPIFSEERREEDPTIPSQNDQFSTVLFSGSFINHPTTNSFYTIHFGAISR